MIAEQFSLTTAEYYDQLHALIDSDEALEHDPLVVRRLRRMRVTKAWQRKGVAKALLDEAIDFCRTQGYERLILDTTEHQTAAQRMYESAGFAKLGQRSLGPFTIYDYALELA